MEYYGTITRSLPLMIERTFTLARFIATHSSFILRSSKRHEHDERIDVLFAGTYALKLRRTLSALTVRHPSVCEAETVERDLDADLTGPQSLNLYMIEGGPSLGYVVGSGMWMSIDREADDAPSPLLGNWESGPLTNAEGPIVQFI